MSVDDVNKAIGITERLRDPMGREVGFVTTRWSAVAPEHGSVKTLSDTQGRVLGHYYEECDRTYDGNGNLVGFGNHLGRMIKK